MTEQIYVYLQGCPTSLQFSKSPQPIQIPKQQQPVATISDQSLAAVTADRQWRHSGYQTISWTLPNLWSSRTQCQALPAASILPAATSFSCHSMAANGEFLQSAPYTANNWLLDSGVTHHITSDLNNLSIHQPYTGGDDVMIVDGSTIPVTHTGSASLPTTLGPLQIKHVLYVPDIHKNLIFVYRLYNSNRVSVEFFLAFFQVKDLSTGVPLLRGKTKDGLYEWLVKSPQVVSLFAS